MHFRANSAFRKQHEIQGRLQVVAGVLSKYANPVKGWRDRLFILNDGKLSYYKVRACRLMALAVWVFSLVTISA